MKGYEYFPVINSEIDEVEKYYNEAIRVLKWLSKSKVHLSMADRIEILDKVFMIDGIKYREFNIEVSIFTLN